jgi:hypothetical protein
VSMLNFIFRNKCNNGSILSTSKTISLRKWVCLGIIDRTSDMISLLIESLENDFIGNICKQN